MNRLLAHLFSLFLIIQGLTPLSSHAQEKEYFKYTTISAEYAAIRLQHYNGPDNNPTRDTWGFSALLTHAVIVSPGFHLDIKLGYRYVYEYAHPYGIGSFSNTPESNLVSFNYNGGYTGLGFNLGIRHLWESSLIVGGGIFKKPGYDVSSEDMEFGLQTGYKYISPFGLMARVGVSTNHARNGFFSSSLAAYFGLGYAFQKPRGAFSKVIKAERGSAYFNFNVNGYIGSVSLDLVGAQFRVDHILYNGPLVDLGYGISFNRGITFEGDVQQSVATTVIGLFGGKQSKFEFTAGPNFPLDKTSDDFIDWYERVQLGVGWCLLPSNVPLSFRVGSSTNSILYAGLGIRIG